VTITIEVLDGRSKFGRAKRQFHAVCSCGWVDAWWPVVRASAVEHGEAHARSEHSAPERQSSRWVREFVAALGDAPLIGGRTPLRCPVCPALVWPSSLYEFGVVSHVSCARTLRASGRAAEVERIIKQQGE
jgi:hypothetical protein